MVDFIIFGLLGRLWWVFDLFANFQVYYFIVAAIGLTYFLLRRLWVWTLLPMAVLLVSSWMIFPVYLDTDFNKMYMIKDSGFRSEPATMRVLFYNMFAFNQEYDVIADHVHEVDPDVVIVAEMVEKSFNEIGARLPEYSYRQWEDGVSTGGDIAFFSKIEPENVEVLNFNERFHLPWFRFEFVVDGYPFVLYGIHPSPPMNTWLYEARTAQLAALASRVKGEEYPVMVIGDFNTTPYSPVLRRLLNDSGLRDSRDGFGVHNSWPNWLPRPLRIPIDHALVSDGVVVMDRDIGPSLNSEHVPFGSGMGSDHFPLIIDVAF